MNEGRSEALIYKYWQPRGTCTPLAYESIADLLIALLALSTWEQDSWKVLLKEFIP